MLKPYSFLLYLLALVTFFFVGISFAGIVGAAKNQGLAGGAILLGYGMLSALIGLIISIFISYKSPKPLIIRLNVVLTICSIGFYAYYHLKYIENQKIKDQGEQKTEQPKQQTIPVGLPVSLVSEYDKPVQPIENKGLGMFSPNVSEITILYFYNYQLPEKSVYQNALIDSITFKKTAFGEFDIAAAPSYLVPEHLKLDYGILYFKAISVTNDFIEIEVNKLTHQTAFVHKSSGVLKYWPAFLLTVNSIEFIHPKTQNIYVKPLNHAGIVKQSYNFMQPLKINQDWMYVLLLNDDFETIGNGWIKWNDNGNLLITYSLLS